jgi:hypothetical protein
LALRRGNPHENIGGAVLNTTWFTTSGTMTDAQNVWQKRSRKTMTSDEIKALEGRALNEAVAEWMEPRPTLARHEFWNGVSPDGWWRWKHSSQKWEAADLQGATPGSLKDAILAEVEKRCLRAAFIDNLLEILNVKESIIWAPLTASAQDICRAALLTDATVPEEEGEEADGGTDQ